MLAPNPEIQTLLGIDKQSSWTRRNRFRFLLALVAIGLAAGGAYWWYARESASKVEYRTSPATRDDLTITVSATGTVEPLKQVDIGSELSGIVKSVRVDYNDLVKAGQVLATLDTSKLQAQTNRTRASVEAARANLAEAEVTVAEQARNLERAKVLFASDHQTRQSLEATQAVYDRALAARDSARAQVRLSEADLAANETDLGKARIVSPIDGIVLERSADPGQTVAASLQAPVLFTIAEDLSKMHLIVDVDEADAATVREGQDATFTVEAHPDKTFQAKVVQLRYAPESTSGVVTYEALLSVDNSDLSLRPGMTATAEIIVDHRRDVLLVPNAALRYSPPVESQFSGGLFSVMLSGEQEQPEFANVPEGKKRLWVLKNGTPADVLITPGLSDGTRTEVVKGDLAVGDQLVTDSVEAE